MREQASSASGKSKLRRGERGQAAIFIVLVLGLFLIGGVGFVVDGANLWFHRQTAQTAADAACAAGAMDLLSEAAGVTPPATTWIPTSDNGSSFHCSGTTGSTQNSTFPPCAYANANGYSGSASQNVQVSFHSISVAADCPTALPFSMTACKADTVAATPYMQVDVDDNVPTTFMRLVAPTVPSVPVRASSTCGLSNVMSTVPVLVLNPNQADTMTGSGELSVQVIGSEGKNLPSLIQVNSLVGSSLDFTGTVNLTNTDSSEGTFAIAGRQSQPGSGYKWVNAAGVVSDPFALIAAPAQPPAPVPASLSDCVPVSSTQGAFCQHCPEDLSISCEHYSPGHYPAGLLVEATFDGSTQKTSGLAFFEPGVYYLEDDLTATDTTYGTCLRPAGGTGKGGTVFYFHGPHTLNVRNSGGLVKDEFNCATSLAVQPSEVRCTPASALPSDFPSGGLTGNVLLGPCEAPSGDPLHAYGDPLGQADPFVGEQRGMLFFQDRDPGGMAPTWEASSFGLIGHIYFHNCGSGSGSGADCNSDAFDDAFTLGGASGYIVGSIVVDKLSINSGSNIHVFLNPNPQYYVLKASLLQ